MNVLRSCLASLLLLPPLAAQTATTAVFGANQCGLDLVVAGAPVPGTTIHVVGPGSVRFGTRLIQRWFLMGTSVTAIGGLPLPIPMETLFPSGFSCGSLLQSSEFVARMPEAPSFQATTVAVPVAIPNDAGLIGLEVYCQLFELGECLGSCAPGFRPIGTASNGVRVRIGL
ncbi:MAG: hypothetical protein AB7O97_06950 [Planctomycetota bacterium]